MVLRRLCWKSILVNPIEREQATKWQVKKTEKKSIQYNTYVAKFALSPIIGFIIDSLNFLGDQVHLDWTFDLVQKEKHCIWGWGFIEKIKYWTSEIALLSLDEQGTMLR
jgi:hypothetical protein